MTTILNDLISQKSDIEQKIVEARKAAHSNAIESIKALVKEHNLDVSDVFAGYNKPARKAKKSVRKPSGKVAAKYKDPASGKTWTGRGIAPVWIAGKDRAQFAI